MGILNCTPIKTCNSIRMILTEEDEDDVDHKPIIMIHGGLKFQGEEIMLSTRRKKIWLAHELDDTSKKVVIKQSYGKSRRAIQEVQCLSLVHNDHIVRIRSSFSDDKHTCIVMDYLNGDDLLTIVNDGIDGVYYLRSIFKDVVQALLYMKEEHSMTHGDISPENIVVVDGMGILIDLEDAKVCSGLVDISIPFGKLRYMDRNVFLMQNPIDPFAADVWSLGVTILTCIMRCSDSEIRRIQKVGVSKVLGNRFCHDDQLFELVCDILNPDPQQRPSIEQIHKHIITIPS